METTSRRFASRSLWFASAPSRRGPVAVVPLAPRSSFSGARRFAGGRAWRRAAVYFFLALAAVSFAALASFFFAFFAALATVDLPVGAAVFGAAGPSAGLGRLLS